MYPAAPVTRTRIILEKPSVYTTNRSSAVRRRVEHLAQAMDFGREIARMIADEEAAVVRDVRIHNRTRGVVVEVADGFVAQEASAGDHANANLRGSERVHDPIAIEAAFGIEDERKAEPRAAAVFTLNDETV